MLVRDSAGIGAVSGELRLGRQAIDGLAENLADALQPRLGVLVSPTVRERFNRDLGSDVERVQVHPPAELVNERDDVRLLRLPRFRPHQFTVRAVHDALPTPSLPVGQRDPLPAPEEALDIGHLALRHEQVQVAMDSALLAEQGIDAPAAEEPVAKVGAIEEVADLHRVLRAHAHHDLFAGDGRSLSRVLTVSKGVSYLVTLSDGVLKSGRAVIGIATQKLNSVASASLASAGPVRAYATTTWLLACSYATRANSWSDLYVYICPRDVYLLSGTLGIIAAATAIFGGPVGIAIATALGLAVVVSIWHFMNNDGSIGITIPAWTISPPFGLWIYYWNRLQAYMYNECWIRIDNWWYKPYCWW